VRATLLPSDIGEEKAMMLERRSRTVLAHRQGDGLDVTLVWVREGDEDNVLICVRDQREGGYFQIPAESHLALDVYYHPFAYRDFSVVDCEDSRIAIESL
jgi:hypothetical protein